MFTIVNTVLCVVGFSLVIVRNYYTPLPKKRGLWLRIYNRSYWKEGPWVIGSWWVSITLTYLLYKLEIMAAFAIINSLGSWLAVMITIIIFRKHAKQTVRRIPIFIITYWVVITGLLLVTGILTKMGLASEMLMVLVQIAAWLFIITAAVSISIIGLIFTGIIAWDLAANVSGKLYK